MNLAKSRKVKRGDRLVESRRLHQCAITVSSVAVSIFRRRVGQGGGSCRPGKGYRMRRCGFSKNCSQGLENVIARHRLWTQTAIAFENEYCYQ
jgi:hypothetical protein